MNKNHNEAIIGTDAIRTFVQQFGPDDIYTEILIEILLEELLLEYSNKKVLYNKKEVKSNEIS